MRRYILAAVLLAGTFLVGLAQCGPIPKNLDSFCLLVPDYSATTGGVQPAVPVDGQSLVFWTVNDSKSERKLHINTGPDFMHSDSGTFELTYPMEQSSADLHPSDSTPTLAWSPRGRRLVVARPDGCLYLIDNLEAPPVHFPLNVRLLAKAASYKGSAKVGQYFNPKWSPDGRKIAVLRNRGDYISLVEVIDVETGKSTVVADDAFGDERAFSQPWSPDSKKIVYAAYETPKGLDLSDTGVSPGLFVVPVDGGPRRKLPVGRGCLSPWWSLQDGRISYVEEQVTPRSSSSVQGFRFAGSLIRTVDPATGARATLLGSRHISPAEQRAFEGHSRAASRSLLERKYASLMTARQLHLLKTGKLDNCLADVAAFFVAKHMGGQLWSLAKVHEKDLGTPRFNLHDDAAFAKARSALVNKPLIDYDGRFGEIVFAALDEWMALPSETFLWLYWSPDHTRFATVSCTSDLYSQTLIVFDTKTGKRTDVCTGDIGCICWADNKTLISQVSRLVLCGREFGLDQSFGYPEIWMMTLK